MRSVRITLGLVVAVCAFSVMALPALAHNFTASKAGKITGGGENTQEFTFGSRMNIICEKWSAKGEVPAGSFEALKTTVKYGHCRREIGPESQPEPLKAKFLGQVSYEYHANGYVVLEGAVEIKISGTKCVVEWAEQIIPVKAEKNPEDEFSAAVFSTNLTPVTNLKKFPTGFQSKLVIANEFKGMEFEVFEGDCEEWTKGIEGKSGKYNGNLEMKLGGGDLGYE